jgi:nucleotide-binding universal stress UspA family protein
MRLQLLLPLVTYPDCNSDAVVPNAVAVAAHLDADLIALALNVDIPPVSNALSQVLLDLPKMSGQAEALSRRRGESLLLKMSDAAHKRGLPISSSTLTDGPALLGEAAARCARYHDLAAAGWEAGNPTSAMTAEALIFGSGRPTVLMPELTTIERIDRVAIAWDGSRVAARAVADALPFLQRASKIHVLTVIDEKPLDEGIGTRLASGLHKRGLPADSATIKAEDCAISVTLQEHALEAGAELLVMGGYGHSRVRDFVLGGATKGILNDLRLPVLLSH